MVPDVTESGRSPRNDGTAQTGWGQIAWLASAAAVAVPATAQATYTPPIGVSAYRLLFVTAETYEQPFSTDIADYDSIVVSQAATNPDLPTTNWRAIGSTATVNAKDHVSCGAVCDSTVPIYLVNGKELAASTNALFQAATTSLLTTPSITQNNTSYTDYVWTGSTDTGVAATDAELGNADYHEVGYADATNGIFLSAFADGAQYYYDYYSYYAISDTILVPEPATGGAILAGGLAVTRILRRRRR